MVVGAVGLHQHPAGPVAPPGPAGHLRHELEGPLGGAEVGHVQRRVGVDHADQRDVGEVEPLGDHLRAEQDPHLARPEGREHLLVAARRPHRVGVHPPHDVVGERRLDLALEPLGADAAVVEVGGAAVGAGGGSVALGVAGVADQEPAALVVGQRHVAGVALHDLAALGVRADDEGVEAAAVEQQDHLALVVEGGGHRLAERLAQAAQRGPSRGGGRSARPRHRPGADALAHRQPGVAAELGVAPGLQRRRGRAEQDRALAPAAPA